MIGGALGDTIERTALVVVVVVRGVDVGVDVETILLATLAARAARATNAMSIVVVFSELEMKRTSCLCPSCVRRTSFILISHLLAPIPRHLSTQGRIRADDHFEKIVVWGLVYFARDDYSVGRGLSFSEGMPQHAACTQN